MTSTSRFLGPLLSWLAPDWSPEQSLHAQVLVRKAAHVGEYGVLGLLLGRALALSFRLRMRFVAASTVLAVSALATADEMRQASVTERTGSWGDVLLDASGGIAALGLLFVVRRWLGRPLFQRAESRPEHA